ncbi:hypothetical protein BaRGS_00032572, partial [Batillaria attramentaria]
AEDRQAPVVNRGTGQACAQHDLIGKKLIEEMHTIEREVGEHAHLKPKWILVLALIRSLVYFEAKEDCTRDLRDHILGYIIILAVCVVLEVLIAWISLRGTILSPEPRSCMEYVLYVRLVMGFLELAWLIVGAVWSAKHYQTCKPETAKKALL